LPGSQPFGASVFGFEVWEVKRRVASQNKPPKSIVDTE